MGAGLDGLRREHRGRVGAVQRVRDRAVDSTELAVHTGPVTR